MKKRKIRKACGLMSAIIALSCIGGCGSKDVSTSANLPVNGKYETPIVVTGVRDVNSTMKYPSGDNIDNNVWTRHYLEDLGIDLQYMWTIDGTQYNQKLNLSIASGELADIVPVDKKQLYTFSENGNIVDLKDVYEKYASDLTKKVMESDGGVAMDFCTIDGKLMALPSISSPYDSAHILWVRADWLDNLGLDAPETIDDLTEIVQKFTENDPDGDGKKDTYGLAIQKELFNGAAGSLNGLFEAYHAYPDGWIESEDGKSVVAGCTVGGAKDALELLNTYYKNGWLDKEFSVKDTTKISEDITSGKVGAMYGAMFNPITPFAACKENDPKADWKPYAIVSADDKPAKPIMKNAVTRYYVVTENAKNPEALIILMNDYLERIYGEKDEYTVYGTTPEGIQTSSYAFVTASPADENLSTHLAVVDALNKNDGSGIRGKQKVVYDNVVNYTNGDMSGYGRYGVFGPGGAFSLINWYKENDMFELDCANGPQTDTMSEKEASLEKLRDEEYVRIIMGESDINAFDTYVENWKKLGGEEIAKEVNEYYFSK